MKRAILHSKNLVVIKNVCIFAAKPIVKSQANLKDWDQDLSGILTTILTLPHLSSLIFRLVLLQFPQLLG